MTEHARDHSPVITISGTLVGLGPLREDLLDTLHLRWGNDLKAAIMFGDVGVGTTVSSRRFFEHRTTTPSVQEFLVYELASNRPVGTTNLHNINLSDRSASLAYGIMEEDCRRKGFGTEAAILTLDYAFAALGLHRVEARVFTFNTPSIRLAARLGFVEVGRRREARWAGGRYWDEIIFDMLDREFTSPVLDARFGLAETEH